MAADKTPPEGPGTTRTSDSGGDSTGQIGNYRILQKVGEGGMGEVFEAEQEKPVRRRVALKVIKPGMDTRQVVARFEAERQALAMMDHPAVAKVFEAGATPRGRPYFVMELVRGVPINEHCDRQKLPIRERLELFLQVCEGVQHAHQNAVIHRDLKPSNVLVTIQDGRAVPKIIDFGVAKATTHKLTEKTMFTELGVLIGTPEYMSPEQAEGTGQSVDTRTDVYSLGVTLYELLVGALPFDSKELRSEGYESLRKKIREEEPQKPSTRLSTLGDRSTVSAKSRRVDLSGLRRQLRGDLDWITMRSLEKDRTRRYGSPAELAEDIRRHLSNEPVVAGPPSAAYRARKFVRRHRVGVGVAALVLGVLVAFAVTTTVQSRRIAREAETSERVSEFLADMLGELNPELLGFSLWEDLRERVSEIRRDRGAPEDEIDAALATLGEALSGVNATDVARRLVDDQILARAARTIEEELGTEPRIAGRLEHTLGVTYHGLGLYKQAERHATRAVETRRRALGPDHPDTLRSKYRLADYYRHLNRFEESEALYLETIEIQRRKLGDEHRHTLDSMQGLATLYRGRGRLDEAEPLLLETLDARKRVFGDDDLATINSTQHLASLYRSQGRYTKAEPLLLETLETRRRIQGDDHPHTLSVMSGLADLYTSQGRHAEAEPMLLQTLETQRRVLGDEHPHTLNSMNNLATLYSDQGHYDEAESLLLETLELRKRVLGDHHRSTLHPVNNLAILYSNQGRYDEAEPLYIEGLEIYKSLLGEDHPDTFTFMNNLGGLHVKQGKHEEARSLLQQALDGRLRVLGKDHLHVGYSYYNLGCLSASLGKREEALDHLEKAVRLGWAERVILEDPTLDALRGDPEFEAIVERVTRRIGE